MEGDTRPNGILFLAVGLFVVLAYLPLRQGGYVQDDHLAVETNRIVAEGNLGEILQTSYWEGAEGNDGRLYRPFPILTYAIERRLTGDADPLLARTLNLTLHLLVSATLFGFARSLGAGVPAATGAAALFAVHPIHVEAVANVVGRSELLAALFSLTTLWLLWRGWRSGRHLLAWAGGGTLLLALCSKEVAVATPLMVVFLAFFAPSALEPFGRRWWANRLGSLAPLFLAVGVYTWLRVAALGTFFSLQEAHVLDNRLVDESGIPRFATALSLLARYLGLLFFPARLSADYSGTVIPLQDSLWSLMPVLGLLSLLLLVTLAARPLWALWSPQRLPEPRGQSHRVAVGTAAMFFLMPYLIVGNLFFDVGTIFAERLMYLPSVGFCLALGVAWEGVLGRSSNGAPAGARAGRLRKLTVILAGIVIVLLLGSRTFVRCQDWLDDETLFTAAAHAYPASPRAHFVMGKMALERGAFEESLPHLDRTLELYPDHSGAWVERGIALAELSRFDAAEASFREALRRRPEHAKAYLNLGIAYRRSGRPAEARQALESAVRQEPRLATAWAELGNLHLAGARYEEAIAAYRGGIALGRKDLLARIRVAEDLMDAAGINAP
jgi:Tfp pilus assembly protein PilF